MAGLRADTPALSVLGRLPILSASTMDPGSNRPNEMDGDNGSAQDRKGIGMDRTVATGTGYIGQYPPQLAAKYKSLETCPDSLLLFMHHVPYNYMLHSGKTLVQHVYDSHYEGAAAAATYAPAWRTLHGLDDGAEVMTKPLALFVYEAGHADGVARCSDCVVPEHLGHSR